MDFRWFRSRVWPREDWCSSLAELAIERPPDVSALELAKVLELVEPDRQRALDMYLAAWRSGDASALEPSLRLAREARDHAALAEVALAEYTRTGDPAHLVVAACAWIDAGRLERAFEVLAPAVQKRPDEVELVALLAAARGELKDPGREVSRFVALASSGRLEPARAYRVATRIARAAKLDELYANLLATAVHRKLGPELAALYEDRLLERGSTDELLAFYRDRLEATRSDRDWADVVRAAATRLVRRGRDVGLALRLLQRSLENAYAARVVEIPGHLASWELLLRHARSTRSTVASMPLIVRALEAPLSDDERLYLARLGFEISIRDAGDRDGARPYARMIAELVPDHPAIVSFLAEHAPMLSDEDVTLDEEVARATAAPPVTTRPPPTPPPPRPPPRPAASASAARPPLARSLIPAAALAALGSKRPGVPAPRPMRADAAPRAARAVVPIDLVLRIPGRSPETTVARDISTSGLFVVTPSSLELGSVVVIDLKLPGRDMLASIEHQVSARVMRRADNGYGVMLIDPTPALVEAIAGFTETSAT